MLVHSTYISIHEVPGETAFILNISECKNNCKGCHSPELLTSVGTFLTNSYLKEVLSSYKDLVTCVCFMGGDDPLDELQNHLIFLKSNGYKTCLYTARESTPKELEGLLDYIKLGPYKEEVGGLDIETTNQVFLSFPENINLNHLFRSNA